MKVVLAALGGTARDTTTLDCAGALARLFASHIIACHVHPDAASMMPMLGGEASGALVAEFLRIAEEEAAAAQKRAHASFSAWHAASGLALATTPATTSGLKGPSVEWQRMPGLAWETLPGLGRVADVLVVARPEDDSAGISVGIIEAALFASGRPVLLASHKMPATLGRNIAVAWNGTPEAAHALAAAMPLLAQADVVSILSHHPGSNGHMGGKDETDVQGLVSYLGWHGITARIAPQATEGLHIGQALVAGAVAASADLLVMGAYGHSRLREMVFGGATRHVVDDGTLPTLLMH